MNKKTVFTGIVAALMLSAITVHAAPQTECPVMGGKVNKSLYADVQGKRIYVCCAGCIAAIKATPEKYIKQMEDKGIELEKTPAKAKVDEHKGHTH
jgi:YHS domain-containing protein